MEIKKIGVIGSGQMGSGIAQVFATCGFEVYLMDTSSQALKKAREYINSNLERSIEKGRLTRVEVDSIKKRIRTDNNLSICQQAEFIIEAVVEDLRVKSDIFKELDILCPEDTILATNTSSISITELASNTKNPSRIIGMHFMNPVPVMKLVEIITGLATSKDVAAKVFALAEKLNKVPVLARDMPGFVSNRILLPMINEAIFCLYEGVATVEDIDKIMKLGMNHPLGPLALADLIGLDTCLFIMNILYEGFNDSKYRPCPLLKNYVRAGWLGKKSGKGFYTY